MIDSALMQVKIVEAFEHAKVRLEETIKLEPNALAKCNEFVLLVNELDTDCSFHQEVAKLSHDELAFSAICFAKNRLRQIAPSFKADNVRKYMKSRDISVVQREEIFTRLKFLSRSQGQFSTIYNTLLATGNKQEATDKSMFLLRLLSPLSELTDTARTNYAS